jgi:hypothetical protein
MRYNAFFGELPINAFKPRPSGGMTLEGGGNPLTRVSNAINTAIEDVGNVGQSLIDTARNHPLETAALIAGGYYFAPELGAWIGSDGSALVGDAAGVEAGAVATTLNNLETAQAIEAATPSSWADTVAPSYSSGSSFGGGSGGYGYASAPTVADVAPAVTAPAVADVAVPTIADIGATSAPAVENAYTAAQDALDATGMSNAGGTTLGPVSNSLAQLAYPAANAAAGAATGSTLSSLLPYMTAANLGAGLLQSNAAKNAADIQSAAAQNATALQGQMFNTINQQQAPYRTAGYQALNNINALGAGPYVQYDASGNPIGTGQGSGYLTHQFNASDLAAGLAPNYDFMLKQGQITNQRAANAAGGGLSGNALQGLNKFTQDYAGNAYQNAFSNYQTQRGNIYNTLAGIAGIGQAGQSASNAAGTNYANQASSLGVGSAGAQAAGQIGQANALSNTANNIMNMYTLSSLLGQRGTVA